MTMPSKIVSKRSLPPMVVALGGTRNRVLNLYLVDTEAPIARLKPAGTKDEVRIGYWSHRKT